MVEGRRCYQNAKWRDVQEKWTREPDSGNGALSGPDKWAVADVEKPAATAFPVPGVGAPVARDRDSSCTASRTGGKENDMGANHRVDFAPCPVVVG